MLCSDNGYHEVHDLDSLDLDDLDVVAEFDEEEIARV